MDSAVITGATGLIGLAVAKYLSGLGIPALCMGRREISQDKVRDHFGETSEYIRLSMDEINSLADIIKSCSWRPGNNAVFFHFAWSGGNGLADGSLENQLNNAACAAEAVRVAKIIGCTKFVNSGSIQESIIERHVTERGCPDTHLDQLNYALAKVASRDMCKMKAYIERIDYVHTRISVPLASDLSRGTYIARTLRRIMEGEVFEHPRNESLYDLVLLEDVARAYFEIAKKGLNKRDYFIGPGQPAPLRHHFETFKHLVNGQDGEDGEVYLDRTKSHCIFDTRPLYDDTGFLPALGLKDIISRALSV